MRVSLIAELFVATSVHFPSCIHEQLKPLEIGSGWVLYIAHEGIYQVAGVRKVFVLTLPYSVLREDRSVLFGELEKPRNIVSSWVSVENPTQRD